MQPPLVMPIESPAERAQGQAAAKHRGAHTSAEENCTSPHGAPHERSSVHAANAQAIDSLSEAAGACMSVTVEAHRRDACDEIMQLKDRRSRARP